jgi:hypothetical protein
MSINKFTMFNIVPCHSVQETMLMMTTRMLTLTMKETLQIRLILLTFGSLLRRGRVSTLRQQSAIVQLRHGALVSLPVEDGQL